MVMIGRFTECKILDQIRNHLIHGRIVYVFSGLSFILLQYNSNDEKGIMKNYNITNNMELKDEEYGLIEMIKFIKTNLNDENYHFLLYYGELTINSSIYDFMKEFYNPTEELPIIVVTAMVDSEYIRNDISHACKISKEVLEKVDYFNSRLMEQYVSAYLSEENSGVHSIFSIWLQKFEDNFKVVFKSKYLDYIDVNEELGNLKDKVLNDLNRDIKRLGVPVNISLY
jgi:hypothetical protein